jgi:glycine/serine hydroxymethyltransferase
MREIADIVNWTLSGKKDVGQICEHVQELCERFPLYMNEENDLWRRAQVG